MKTLIIKTISLLLLLLLLTGCTVQMAPLEEDPPPTGTNQPSTPPEIPPESKDTPVAPALTPRETLIRSCQQFMTTEEKVGQLFFVRCPEVNAALDVEEYHLGGLLLFGRDFKDRTAEAVTGNIESYQRAARSEFPLPLLIGVDEEGGSVVRVSSNRNLWDHTFASPQKLYGEGGLDRVREDAAEKCRMLNTYGINVNFAPVADVSTTPGDFIYKRSLGQDAETTAAYTAAVVGVMDENGVGAVLKHFPGYGNNADTHTGIAVDSREYGQFVEEDFLPFQSGMAAGNAAVLVSHNIVTCMDDTLPASLSPEVHRVLREELGFDGVVLTDDLAMGAIDQYTNDGSAAVLAILAGNDMVVTTDYHRQIPLVVAAVETGEIPMEIIDAALGRVIGWKYDLGLIDDGDIVTPEGLT